VVVETLEAVDEDIITSVKPPITEPSEDYDGGHTPEYSSFALVDLFPNQFFGDKEAIDSLRDEFVNATKDPERVWKVERDLLDKFLGLKYDEKDKISGTILWAKTYKEIKNEKTHTYFFEDCAIYTVGPKDRMYSNTYTVAAITKIDDRFYTFLTQREFEDLDFTPSDGESAKFAEATVRALRGSWGNQTTAEKAIVPRAYVEKEPLIVTVKMPFHNYQDPPLAGGWEFMEGRDEDTLEKLRMYDRKFLEISKGLTVNLLDMLSKKGPKSLQSGSDLRYFIHKHLFPDTNRVDFVDINETILPEHLSQYEIFSFE